MKLKKGLGLLNKFLFWCVYEGSRTTTRDAGQIDFRIVHVVAKVVSHTSCRCVLANGVEVHTWGHCKIRIGPAHYGPTSSQKLVWKDPCLGCWYSCQNQKWTY